MCEKFLFDDRKSIVHFSAGALSPLIPFVMVIFLLYEIVEKIVMKESGRHFVGDLCEFSIGFVVGWCLKEVVMDVVKFSMEVV